MMSVWIFGAGSNGRVALEILGAASRPVAGFVDDRLAGNGNAKVNGVQVWSETDFRSVDRQSEVEAFVAIGSNDARVELSEKLRSLGYSLCNAIHPSAVVMPSAILGTNVLICPQAFVGTGVRIEDSTVINTKCSVDHDSVIGVGAYLAPGVTTAGRVRVGKKAFVGLGANLGPNVQVGEGAVVGAGAVLLNSVPPSVLVAGAPARFIRRVKCPVDWGSLLAPMPTLIQETRG